MVAEMRIVLVQLSGEQTPAVLTCECFRCPEALPACCQAKPKLVHHGLGVVS